jgi:hypothetical protein
MAPSSPPDEEKKCDFTPRKPTPPLIGCDRRVSSSIKIAPGAREPSHAYQNPDRVRQTHGQTED